MLPLPPSVSPVSLGPLWQGQDRAGSRKCSPGSFATSWQNCTAFPWDTFPLLAAVLGYALSRPCGDVGLAGALWVTKTSSATSELHQPLILISFLS